MRLKWTFLDIFRHSGTFGTFDVISGQFGRLYDEFRLFSQSFSTIFSHNQLIEKNALRTDGPTGHGWTDGQTLQT